ncbi:MAG: hypothetical protein ACPGSC_08840 [Granulosicoccaceae bacterium]
MKPVLLALSLTLCAPWLALQAQANDGVDPLFGSCEDAPEKAVTAIEHEVIAQYAQVACTVFGHVVIPSERYFWSFYGDVVPVVLAAQEDKPDSELKAVFHEVHFTRVDARELTGDEAATAFEDARFGSHFPAEVMPSVYTIKTLSNTGIERAIFIYQSADQVAAAIPYPEWFDRIDDRPLLPIFVYDKLSQDNQESG